MGLWEMSLSGGVLILVILAARRMFGNRLPRRTFLILWTVALLRLLVPFSVAVPYNAHVWMRGFGAMEGLERLEEFMGFSERKAEAPAQGGAIQEYMEGGGESIQEYAESGKEAAQEYAGSGSDNFHSLWVAVYFAGALLCAAYYLITYLKCRREFRFALPTGDPAIQEWVRSFSLKRRVQVRQSGMVAAPMTYGTLHPVILLPKGIQWENSRQMQFVLTHELVHIRRFDAARKLLFLLAVCVHWCNPLVWVMNILANRDMELVCDEWTLRYFGKEARSAYALSLISLAERKSNYMACGNSFSKDAMEERIAAIMKKKRPAKGAAAGAAALIVFVVILFAASAVQRSAGEEYVADAVEQGTVEQGTVEQEAAEQTENEEKDGIIIQIPARDAPLAGGGSDSEEVWESETVLEGSQGESGFINLLENVYRSEEFPEYEEFGLSYDEKNKHFLYQGEIVRYFKDEMTPGLFRRFIDERGSVDLVVLRDASWNMTGFQEK